MSVRAYPNATAATFVLTSVPAKAVELASGASSEIAGTRESINSALEWIATAIEIAGVSIIVISAAAATIAFLYDGLVAVGWPAAFRRFRANLGRGILLGLEFLVAADIIGTVAVTPSFENLAILAFIVVIRTFLSFSLEVEIEGRWPWHRASEEATTGEQGKTQERL